MRVIIMTKQSLQRKAQHTNYKDELCLGKKYSLF